MPSVTHEAPIELIRQHPGLAVELLQAMSDVDLPAEIAVSLGPTDLSEVVPIKFLADAVVIVGDKATGEPALIIIIEPIKAKAEDVLKIIDARGIDVTADQRERISSCTDIDQLDEWFDSALIAGTAAEILKS